MAKKIYNQIKLLTESENFLVKGLLVATMILLIVFISPDIVLSEFTSGYGYGYRGGAYGYGYGYTDCPPATPATPTVVSNTSSSADITWIIPQTNCTTTITVSGTATSFTTIERTAANGSSYSSLTTVDFPTATYTDTSVTAGNTYLYRILVTDSESNTSSVSSGASVAVGSGGGGAGGGTGTPATVFTGETPAAEPPAPTTPAAPTGVVATVDTGVSGDVGGTVAATHGVTATVVAGTQATGETGVAGNVTVTVNTSALTAAEANTALGLDATGSQLASTTVVAVHSAVGVGVTTVSAAGSVFDGSGDFNKPIVFEIPLTDVIPQEKQEKLLVACLAPVEGTKKRERLMLPFDLVGGKVKARTTRTVSDCRVLELNETVRQARDKDPRFAAFLFLADGSVSSVGLLDNLPKKYLAKAPKGYAGPVHPVGDAYVFVKFGKTGSKHVDFNIVTNKGKINKKVPVVANFDRLWVQKYLTNKKGKVDYSRVVLMRYDAKAKKWSPVAGAKVNPAGNVEAQTDQLGAYAIFAKK